MKKMGSKKTRSALEARCRRPTRAKEITSRPIDKRAPGRRTKDPGFRILSIRDEVQQSIASDLHDSTCQYLIAASLNIARLRGVKAAADVTERIFSDIDSSIDQALRDIRALTYLWHPQAFIGGSLKTSIERYVEGFARRTSLQTTVAIAPEIDVLPDKAQCSLLRVVQEALTNVYRHAKATRVKVTVEVIERHLELRVSDDGAERPFSRPGPGADAIPSGVGMSSIGIRAHQLGGRFEISSSAATEYGGTTLSVVIPLALKGAPEKRYLPIKPWQCGPPTGVQLRRQ